MDNLFTGNIVQRTWEETRAYGSIVEGEVFNYILKENAILYKTKNGGYVDIESLNKNRDYRSVDKVTLEYGATKSKKGIWVMPAASFSAAIEETKRTRRDSTLGIFVDLDTLKPYNTYENTENSLKNKTR